MTRLLLTITPAAAALLLALLVTVTTTTAFTQTTRGYTTTSTQRRFTFLNSNTNDDDGLGEPPGEEEEQQQEQASAPRRSFEPQLISTVTAVNPNLDEEAEDTGVIPRDGSLLLLIPSLVISVGGFLAAIGIALNSGDAISQAVNEMEQSYVDSFKPKPAVYTSPSETETCRGLCSNQEQDLDGLRSFMQKISRTTATATVDSTLEMDTVLVEEEEKEEESSVVSTDVMDDVPSSNTDVLSSP